MRDNFKLIFPLVLLVVLCVGATYSWVLDEPDEGIYKKVMIEYGDGTPYEIGVEASNLNVELLVKNSDGVYRDIEDTLTNGDADLAQVIDDESLFCFENMVPSQSVDFMLRFKNNSSEAIDVSVSFIDIETTTPVILDALYVCVTHTVGYESGFYDIPSTGFISLSEVDKYNEERDTHLCKFLNNVQIPPTGENEYVELYCYLYFDRNADIETYANCDFLTKGILIVI